MFKPTFLYIKQHSVTGKCYFGKTTNPDPVKYSGSGKHWLYHVKKHGFEYVETLWYKLFTDQAECTRVAILFSEQQDIVNSDRWLNLIAENGLDGPGRLKGHTVSKETRRKISEGRKDIQMSDDQKAKVSKQWKGRVISTEHRAIISSVHKGKIVSIETREKLSAPKKKVVCPHCQKEGGAGNMLRYHFDNCKSKDLS